MEDSFRDTSGEASPKKSSKNGNSKSRLQKYRSEWEQDDLFKPWLTKSKGINGNAFCMICETSIQPRKASLLQHLRTKSHCNAMTKFYGKRLSHPHDDLQAIYTPEENPAIQKRTASQDEELEKFSRNPPGELAIRDESFIFGHMVAAQMRKLSRRNRAIAKNTIQNFLFDMEMREMGSVEDTASQTHVIHSLSPCSPPELCKNGNPVYSEIAVACKNIEDLVTFNK